MKRYKCYLCGRTFIPTTGTSIYYLHKRNQFIENLIIIKEQGILPLHVICKKFKICYQTAFDWRHKLLLNFVDKKILLKNDIQFYDLCMNFSVKGRKNAKIKLRQNKYENFNNILKFTTLLGNEKLKLNIARVGKKIYKTDINRTIQDSIKDFSKLICLKSYLFQDILEKRKLVIEEVKQKVEIMNVINMGKSYKSYIGKKFRGVSTKYVQLYASYYIIREKSELFSNYHLLFKNVNVWFTFIRLEKLYKEFLSNYSIIPYTIPIKSNWKTLNNLSVMDVF